MKQLLPQAHPEQSQGTPGEKSHLKLKHSSKQRLAPLPVHKLYGSLPVDTFGNSRTRRSMDARLPPSLSRPHPSGHGTAWPLHHKPSCSTLETLPHSPSTCPRAAIFPTFWPNCPPTLLPLAAVTLGDPSDLPSPLCPTAATVPAGWLQVGAVVSALLLCNARQLLQPQGSAPPGSPRPSSITCRPGP